MDKKNDLRKKKMEEEEGGNENNKSPVVTKLLKLWDFTQCSNIFGISYRFRFMSLLLH